MAARLATPTGRAQYRQRSALVEPGFAQIFQRFGRHLNYRGRQAVDAELKLLGTVHMNRSGFDRGSIFWKDRVRYGEAIPEGAQGAGR
ncbi:transposase, partial [Streptomyces sp. NPDC005195]|uniref:transposase n=1 Tax=Streptomyces sp. NPDC005195 TaxID=3154561 RepID=UPI0033BA339F